MSNLSSDVAINLDGNETFLRPSLKAAQAITRTCGGTIRAIQQLNEGNIDTFIAVVRAGLPKGELRHFTPDEVAEAVYQTGMNSLAKPLSTFLIRLQESGSGLHRQPGDEDEGAEGNDLHVS